MKIIYYHLEKKTPMYLWQYDHIVDELMHHDIELDMFNPRDYETFEQANEKLIDAVKNGGYDLFITCHNEEILYIDTLAEIKRAGIPTLLICFDNLLVPYEHKNICKHFDLVWLTSLENSEMFLKWGSNIIFQPYAANPFYFVPQETDEQLRVAFVGTPYGSRANTINQLINNGVPVTIFGKMASSEGKQHVIKNGFYHTVKRDLCFPIGRKLLLAAAKQRVSSQSTINIDSPYLEKSGYVEKLTNVYSGYALSLASTTARNTGVLSKPVPVVNLRSFEIPMCGGIQFCEYNEELAGYFEDGKEIIFYHNQKEMIEKAKFYLLDKNSTLRKQIKENARLRAQADHTWFKRFSAVFNELGINNKI